MTPVRLEPPTPRSRVKHSTTEPLCSLLKHMLWALKRTVSMSSSFEHPKYMFKLMDKKIIAILRKLFLLNWAYDYKHRYNLVSP